VVVFGFVGGLTVVVFQQPTEPLMTMDRAITLRTMVGCRHQDDIAFALVRAFPVIMAPILGEGIAERTFPKQDQP
jgi:hypothetical protein